MRVYPCYHEPVIKREGMVTTVYVVGLIFTHVDNDYRDVMVCGDGYDNICIGSLVAPHELGGVISLFLVNLASTIDRDLGFLNG